MWRLIAGVAAVSVISVGTVNYIQENNLNQIDSDVAYESSNTAKSSRKTSYSKPAIGRSTRLKMDSRGHFATKARMNGRTIEVLVDTGATSVAIDQNTARRLGIRLKPSDFKHKVSTANGVIKAASATIDKIQIGRVTVHNVQTAVLEGDGLGQTLLGMSFLGQLKEFKISNGELLMRQ